MPESRILSNSDYKAGEQANYKDWRFRTQNFLQVSSRNLKIADRSLLFSKHLLSRPSEFPAINESIDLCLMGHIHLLQYSSRWYPPGFL